MLSQIALSDTDAAARVTRCASAVAVTRTSPKTLHVKGLHAAIRLP
jgi:hypothetical protein